MGDGTKTEKSDKMTKPPKRPTAKQLNEKVVLGLIEEITLYDTEGKKKKLLAKIDTGANISSVDIRLASELLLGPITKTKSVISSHGRSLRPIVPIKIDMAGVQVEGDFTLYNRSHMTYPVLIGRNILEQGFLIDPSMNLYPEKPKKNESEVAK